uniref:Secreted protein n=1 Tax=Kalanchoe fedtschenkoi TaxID=63787 RepID=A0A7N0T3C6_KALFE
MPRLLLLLTSAFSSSLVDRFFLSVFWIFGFCSCGRDCGDDPTYSSSTDRNAGVSVSGGACVSIHPLN